MKRNIVSVVLCVAVLLTLGAAVALAAGGDSITIKATANPQGGAANLTGSGTYALGTNNGVQNTLKSIYFLAKDTTSGQVTYNNNTQRNMGNWSGSLNVVAGTYNCWAEINTQNGVNAYSTNSNTINNVVVK